MKSQNQKGADFLAQWINGAWVLVLILGLIGASCATQAITDHRPPTPDRQ